MAARAKKAKRKTATTARKAKSAKKSASRKKASKKKKKAGRKKAARKKAAKKKAGKKTAARRGPGRPSGGDSKTRGSQVSRRQIRQIAARLLKEAKGRTREEAAERTGALVDDVKNLKAGNLPSLKLILRVVREGRFDPDALVRKNDLKKLPASVSTRGARSAAIAERVRKLAKNGDPAALADKTGLSIYTIYQHRVANKRVGLHTILAFVDAGVVSPREIFLGRS
ncbi:MAG: hypothetical protein QF570_05725 [Myxococcota bacterium]|nr:hypothetical protein [Myxococcota bacterium]